MVPQVTDSKPYIRQRRVTDNVSLYFYESMD